MRSGWTLYSTKDFDRRICGNTYIGDLFESIPSSDLQRRIIGSGMSIAEEIAYEVLRVGNLG